MNISLHKLNLWRGYKIYDNEKGTMPPGKRKWPVEDVIRPAYLQIMYLLNKKKLRFKEIQTVTGLSKAPISQFLNYAKQKGFLEAGLKDTEHGLYAQTYTLNEQGKQVLWHIEQINVLLTKKQKR